MALLTRHQIRSLLLNALRVQGLGVRDLFDGRQEPLSWFVRCLALDQSELDIVESGAVEALHAPTALLELMIDEFALGCVNIGVEGLASYLVARDATTRAEGTETGTSAGALQPDGLSLSPEVMLGFLSIEVAPPAAWLEDRAADAAANERLASLLARMAREVGSDCDSVGVHLQGMLEPEEGWGEASTEVRPAGVSVHFTFDIPLLDAEERDLARILEAGGRTASAAIERMRALFRET